MKPNLDERHLPLDECHAESSTDCLELNTHSFIVKIWLEETSEETGRATWRGYITHVPSGERRYFQDLKTASAFIVDYLEQMDVVKISS